MIRQFTTIYAERNPQRIAEYRTCFQQNISCPALTEICVSCKGGENLLPRSEKLRIRSIDQRPTYTDFLDCINELASADDVSIIANTDIRCDNQLNFQFWQMPSVVPALSRWDKNADSVSLYEHGDSQDSLIVR